MKRVKEIKVNGLPFSERVDTLNVDLAELLSRKVVDTTINKIIFRLKDGVEGSSKWATFVDSVLENNNLERIFKSDTKIKSKYGKSYIGFDIYKGQPHIWIADNSPINEALRINGIDQWACIVERTYSTVSGSPILRNQIIYTDKNYSVLFMGGFGLTSKSDIDKLNKNGVQEKDRQYALGRNSIPLQWARVSIPDYIVSQFKTGTFNHKYGVIPCVEMLNKEFIDNDAGGYEGDNPLSDEFFSDWYVAKDLFELYNGFLQYFGNELLLDHTRVMGFFSQQDMNGIQKNDRQQMSTRDFMTALKNKIIGEQQENKENNWLKKKLILKSIGSEGSKIEKMQSTLRGLEHIQSLNELTTYAFKVCGYSWETESAKVYENVSQTMNSSKGVYETTKEKITLFTRQWVDFFSRLAFAYFNNKPRKKFLTLHQCKKEFLNCIDFQIISNVLQQENNDWKKVMELKDSGLISTEKAIRDINPELNNDEIVKELNEIENEKPEENSWFDNGFDNQDNFGSEEDENPVKDNFGEKKNSKKKGNK